MSKYGSDDLTIQFDNSSNALQDISGEILVFNGFDIEALLEESHGFGDAWVEQLFTGLKRVADITMSGFYDDASPDGTDELFNAIGNATSRTLKVTWGSAKTTLVETRIKRYVHRLIRGEVTKFEVVLVATGPVTET